MNWSLMYNGAWDYGADTRGYTIGTMEELRLRNWSLRMAHVMEPTTPNGPTFDTRISKNRDDMVEWERRYTPRGRFGALRILGFANREHAGTYREAVLANGATDIEATRRNGTLKYGFGVNFEQSLTPEIGVFGRYGWNDGKTESWAFTQIDRSLSGGVSVNGKLWKRKNDHLGVAGVRNQISGDQRCFSHTAASGSSSETAGWIITGPRTLSRLIYSWRATKEWTITADLQPIQNPAYNADRGPVSVGTIRLHWER
jgi:high affinity Mn2+ porin